MPPMEDPGFTAKMQQLNQIFEQEAAKHPGVLYVDSTSAVSGPGGVYQTSTTDTSGETVTLRTPDGVHLTPSGGEAISREVIEAIDHRWKLSLTP